MNFAILTSGENFDSYWSIGFFAITYVILLAMAILEPTKPLRIISNQETEDHEY